MNTRRHFMRFGAGAIGCACVAFTGVRAAAPEEKYRCPPCRCDMDGHRFDEPGTCPDCGMQLVPESSIEEKGTEQGKPEAPEKQPDPR